MNAIQIATTCAWCNQAQGKPQGNGSHGICSYHRDKEREKYKASTARPPVEPVTALCGHVGRSTQHTCGAANCIRLYSW
jgi:hypothetical protein